MEAASQPLISFRAAPRRLRGRPSGLKGAAHRAARDGLRPPLTPETSAAPGQTTARAGPRACPPARGPLLRPTRSYYRKSLRFQGIASGGSGGGDAEVVEEGLHVDAEGD